MELGSKININITTGTVIKIILLIAAAYFVFILRDLALALIAAVVFASAAEPITKKLVSYRIPRLAAVVLIYISSALIIVGTFYFLLLPLSGELSSFLSNMPVYLSSLEAWSPIQATGILQSDAVVQSISKSLTIKDIIAQFTGIASNSSDGLIRTLSTMFGGFVSLILIFVVSFYLSVQEDGVSHFLRVITPFRYKKYVVDLWKRSQYKIGLWMQGQLLLVVIVSVLVYLGLTILGVRHALLLAVLAGLFEIVPIFGPILASIPGIAIASVDGGVSLGLVVVGMYLIIQQFENHLIYPLVVKKVTGVPVLLVIVALIVGAKLAGFLGILLSAPLATIVYELFNDFQKRQALEEIEPKA
ncbi:MAG: AI-2E family transporter [Candidatus Paceibacterota bacterium]|jgi:predicted PurR-regulated permease PerM